MIKFFRTIRKSLLRINNTGRYLTYAIGEIVLVVIGILIALQVNNWNQNRINRIQEQRILLDLKNEFEENKRELKEKEMIRELVISSTKNLNHIINRKKLPKKRSVLDSLFNFSTYVATYDPRNGVLNNLIHSGEINLLRNHELKSLLTNWEGALAELNEHESVALEITIQFASNTLLDSGFDLRNINKFNFTNYLEGDYRPLEQSSNEFDYHEYFTNKSIVNYLSIQHDMAQFAKMESVGIFEMIDKILLLIDAESR